jgi:hypothetical protein
MITEPSSPQILSSSMQIAALKTERKLRNKDNEDPEDPGSDEEGRDWEYYSRALIALNSIPGFKFEVSEAAPEGYRWLRRTNVPPAELKDLSGITEYLHPVKDVKDYNVISDHLFNIHGSEIKFFRYMLPVVALGLGDNRSGIRKAIATQLLNNPDKNKVVKLAHCDNISVHKPEEVLSFIPELAQLPSELSSSGLTFYDFLPWLYKQPEIEAFALHVGRAAQGPQKALLAGHLQPLDHSYRQVLILKSGPRLGKTYFNNFLIQGFEAVNLQCQPVHDLNSKFGHGRWFASNWAYMDDSDRNTLQKFYSEAFLKSVATNELMTAENKGTNAYMVKACCAVTVLANNTDQRDAAKADDGNNDRLITVVAKSFETCSKTLPEPDSLINGAENILPAKVIQFLCTKYNVSETQLAMFFIRLCLDYYQSFNRDELDLKILALKADLYEKSFNTNTAALIRAAVFAQILLVKNDNLHVCDKWKDYYGDAGNSTEFILTAIQNFCILKAVNLDSHDSGRIYAVKAAIYLDYLAQGKPTTHPYRGFENFSGISCRNLYFTAQATLEKLRAGRGLDIVKVKELFAKAFEDLFDTNGVSVPYNMAAIQAACKAAVELNIKDLLKTSQDVKKLIMTLPPGRCDFGKSVHNGEITMEALRKFEKEEPFKEGDLNTITLETEGYSL